MTTTIRIRFRIGAPEIQEKMDQVTRDMDKTKYPLRSYQIEGTKWLLQRELTAGLKGGLLCAELKKVVAALLKVEADTCGSSRRRRWMSDIEEHAIKPLRAELKKVVAALAESQKEAKSAKKEAEGAKKEAVAAAAVAAEAMRILSTAAAGGGLPTRKIY